jgi:hypothetical protein
MLDVFDQVPGRAEFMEEGLEEGPRKPGHSGSPAKAQETRKSDAMTIFIVLLDYRCG